MSASDLYAPARRAPASNPCRVLLCRCTDARLIPPENLAAAERCCAAVGTAAVIVDDLCRLAARQPEALRHWATCSPLLIGACHPRAVLALAVYAGVEKADERITAISLRSRDAINTFQRALAAGNFASEPLPAPAASTDDWIPWYPLIDRERCTNCGQCESFCLFGVYARDANSNVHVVHPDRCKNRCPACARICPNMAIIFPKCAETPIDGAEMDDSESTRAEARQRSQAALGADPYAFLAERRRRRREPLVDRERLARTLAERERRQHANRTQEPSP